MDEEPLGRIHVDEVLQIIESGEIIEQYLDDTPYESCLFWGIRDPEGRSISSVRRFLLRSD
jgi:hypothetical protein